MKDSYEIYPPKFSVGDSVQVRGTEQTGTVIATTWRDDSWHVLVDRPHTHGSVIRQTYRESELK